MGDDPDPGGWRRSCRVARRSHPDLASETRNTRAVTVASTLSFSPATLSPLIALRNPLDHTSRLAINSATCTRQTLASVPFSRPNSSTTRSTTSASVSARRRLLKRPTRPCRRSGDCLRGLRAGVTVRKVDYAVFLPSSADLISSVLIIELDKPFVVGRKEGCDYRLDEPNVSGTHCRIYSVCLFSVPSSPAPFSSSTHLSTISLRLLAIFSRHSFLPLSMSPDNADLMLLFLLSLPSSSSDSTNFAKEAYRSPPTPARLSPCSTIRVRMGRCITEGRSSVDRRSC